MTEGIVGRIVEAARREHLEPVAEDVADVLWLAHEIATTPGRPPPTDARPRADPPVSAPPPEPPTRPAVPDEPPADQPPSVPTGRRADVIPVTVGDRPRSDGIPFRAPEAPALPGRLALTRALRPFKRRIPAGHSVEFDAEATARVAAETDLWLPVFRPRPDRWLDVAVVVDEASSMVVSARVVQELVAILTELGAFRDVRLWRCDAEESGAELALHAGGGHRTIGHDARALVDPAGRRAVVAVSDCIGPAWSDGRMARALRVWSDNGPVAVVQPLPQRMWDQCAPLFSAVTIRSGEPGAANRDLVFECTDGTVDPKSAGTVIPVLELSRRWLASWARLVTAGSGHWVPGKGLCTGAMTDGSAGPEETGDPASGPADLVAAFGAHASPVAYRLATFLAAAAPLSLPVMRMIQRVKLPESPPSVLREVFLGRLLEQTSTAGPDTDPDEVRYDFRPGVRHELLAQLTRQEALSVLVEVSRYLVRRLGASVDFLALLTAEVPVANLDESGRAFAQVAVDVLRSIGGTYRDKAERLLERLNLERPPTAPPEHEPVVNIAQRTTTGGARMTERSHSVSAPIREVGGYPAGWRTIPPRNPHFVGRERMLQELRELLLNRAQTAVLLPRALFGLGGVGKTQVAAEYAHRYRDDYDLLWWIAAEDPAEVRRSLVELAGEMKLPVSQDSAETIRRVLDALAHREPYRRWLIIFDNSRDPGTLAGLIPDSRAGHVLVTTRDEAWGGEGHSVEVGLFARPESVALLRQRVTISDDDADAIADKLGDLPISLAQAAAWHTETAKSVAEYLRRFDAEVARRAEVPVTYGYSRPAAAAMSIAFTQLRDKSPEAAELLRLGSYFGPEWITLEVLHRGRYAPGLSGQLGRVLRDQAPLQRATREISALELARYDTRSDRFQIHRLVQALVQAEMSPDEQSAIRSMVQRMLAHANPGNPERVDTEEMRKHGDLSPHIVPSGLIESDDEASRQVVLDQIRYRYQVGDYESSRDLAREVVAVWERRWGHDDEMTLLARRHLANAIRELGNPAEALTMDEEILQRFQATLGPNHEHSLGTVTSVAADLRSVGEFHRARALDEENYQRHLAVFGEEDQATLRAGNSFAVDLRMLGDFAGALELDRQVEATRRRLYGEIVDTLHSVNSMALDLYGRGQYAEALRIQEEALPRHETIAGPNHRTVLFARRTQAVCYRKLGQAGRARDLAQELLLAYRNRYGTTHENVLAAMMTLANAQRDNGDLVQALRMAEDALRLYREHFPRHPFTQVCATNLAIAHRQAGAVARARELNDGALIALRDMLGPDHPYTLCCAANLASDFASAGDYAGALSLSRETLQRSIEVRGPDHPYTLACANNHALDLAATGSPDASELRERTLNQLRSNPNLGEAHPDTVLAKDGRRIDCDIEPPPT